jgi:hypothetical protein
MKDLIEKLREVVESTRNRLAEARYTEDPERADKIVRDSLVLLRGVEDALVLAAKCSESDIAVARAESALETTRETFDAVQTAIDAGGEKRRVA